MGIYDELKKTQKPVNAKMPIVKAKKKFHKGFLFGHISNGNGLIKLDDEYALRIVVLDDSFVSVELLDYGKELIMETQTWQKTKTIEKKLGNIKTVINKEEENLF